jgi:RNA recognition motif-containing protein
LSFRERPISLHDPEQANRSIYVTGLPWDTTNDELGSFFTIVGDVVSAIVLHERRSGRERSLGCGIVQFTSAEDAQKAIANLNETMFRDRIIRIREDRSPGAVSTISGGAVCMSPTSIMDAISPHTTEIEADPRRVHVSCLPREIGYEEICNLFASAGAVVSAKRLSAKAKRTSSWVVDFADADTATVVIDTFNGFVVDEKPISLRLFSTSTSAGSVV